MLLLLVGKPKLPQPGSQEVAQSAAPSSAAASDSLAWNDPWDQELATMREQVLAVELDWSRSDDSFNYFGERLQALETE